MTQQTLFKIRDKRSKGWFWLDNEYFNGYAKLFGTTGTAIYLSLCRHSDNEEQKCFPSEKTIAKELNTTDRTVRKYLKWFLKYKFIDITKERTSDGKWLNNIYWLLDKTEWIHPEEIISDGLVQRKLKTQPEEIKDTAIGRFVPLNKTHNNNTHNNYTNTTSKEVGTIVKPIFQGNEDINLIIGFLKEKLGGTPDGSVRENRRFAKLLLDKFRKDYPDKKSTELVCFLIEAGLTDSFHGKNITNFKYLYYHSQQIIQSIKGRQNNKIIL